MHVLSYPVVRLDELSEVDIQLTVAHNAANGLNLVIKIPSYVITCAYVGIK